MMTMEQRVTEIHERIFDDALFDSIRAAYDDEAQIDGLLSDIVESYQKAKAVLPSLLSREQAANLAEAERLSVENEKWAMRFAYIRGAFSGFEQYFTQADAENVFIVRVMEQVMQMPNMQLYREYYERRNAINALFAKTGKNLCAPGAERVTDIEVACQDRLFGVLRYAFYTGYRYALSVVEMAGTGEHCALAEKRIQTERDLGLSPIL